MEQQQSRDKIEQARSIEAKSGIADTVDNHRPNQYPTDSNEEANFFFDILPCGYRAPISTSRPPKAPTPTVLSQSQQQPPSARMLAEAKSRASFFSNSNMDVRSYLGWTASNVADASIPRANSSASASTVLFTKSGDSFLYDENVVPQAVIENSTSETHDDDDDDSIGGQTYINPGHRAMNDPFEAREGKTLSWRNVNMTLVGKGDEPDRKLLDDVWGEIPPTETTAIMGASGAGKSSLLNLLSGRARSTGRLRIDADVRLDNFSVDPTDIKVRKSIAFVAQDDSLQHTATPREAIKFSAKLRLPRSTKDSSIDKLVNRMLKELGLSACADTIVGGPLIKGISGGERKRTSVGVELVVKPSMVFLDEPTSGLDAFSAVQVCQVLKKVANAGASVLFTIHQPSSEIFDSFDHLILLHKGRVLFQGSVRSVPSFFAARGHPCPLTYNPADWIIHVAQKYPVEMLERTGFFPKDNRNNVLPTIRDDFHDELGEKVSPYDDFDIRPPHWRTQVRLLFQREFVYMYRYSTPQKARFGLTAFLSTLIGMIFFKVGETSPADSFNLQSQFGAVMILLMLAMLGTAQPAILCFPEERPIFLREYSTKHYSVFSYFISRLFIEMVNTAIQVFIMVTIIHSMVGFRGSYENFFLITFALAMTATAMAVTLGVLAGGDVGVAQQLIPIIFIPQLLFSGFFVATDLIPKILRWAQSLCVLTYAVRLLLVEEFYNCSENSLEKANCNYLLASTKSDVNDTFSNWIILLCQFVAWRCIALFLLRKSATKFY